MSERTDTVTRIPRELLEQLRELAERNDRTIAAELRRAVTTHLAHAGSASAIQRVYENALDDVVGRRP